MKTLELINSDWKRYTALHKKPGLVTKIGIFFHNPGIVFSVFYRIEGGLLSDGNKLVNFLGYFLYPSYYLFTYYVLSIDIPPSVVIGKGLYIHNRGITFSNTVKAGNSLTLIGPLTIGMKGTESGGAATPKLGNNVYVFAGARIIGGITLGNNVYVGANAVVTKNFSSNVVLGGVPAKIIKKTK